jgi:hypothetical protein
MGRRGSGSDPLVDTAARDDDNARLVTSPMLVMTTMANPRRRTDLEDTRRPFRQVREGIDPIGRAVRKASDCPWMG